MAWTDALLRQTSRLWRDRRLQHQLLNGSGLLAGVGAGVAGYAFFHEPLNIGFEQLTVRLQSEQGRLPARGLRILHISDTHFQGHNWRERAKIERIRRLTQNLDYDLLVHTGDFVHYDSGLDNVAALLDALPAPRLGSYAVFGNHDYSHYDMRAMLPFMWRTYWAEEQSNVTNVTMAMLTQPWHALRFGRFVRNTPVMARRSGSNDSNQLAKLLRRRGFHLLHNCATRIQHNVDQDIDRDDAVDIYLAGVDDVTEGRPHIHDALAGIPYNAPTILLSHNPDILQSPRMGQVDLVLAGHTHGGQIVLPVWGPAHTQARYLERRDVAGYLRRGRTQVYITRGVGEGIPLRFAAKPQVALITIMGD